MPLRASAMDWGRNKILRMGKNAGPILSPLWTKVPEILGHCKGALVLYKSLPDCLRRVSFRRHSPSSLDAVENRTNVRYFGPIFSGKTTPTFLQQIDNAIYCPPFGKVWLSSVC